MWGPKCTVFLKCKHREKRTFEWQQSGVFIQSRGKWSLSFSSDETVIHLGFVLKKSRAAFDSCRPLMNILVLLLVWKTCSSVVQTSSGGAKHHFSMESLREGGIFRQGLFNTCDCSDCANASAWFLPTANCLQRPNSGITHHCCQNISHVSRIPLISCFMWVHLCHMSERGCIHVGKQERPDWKRVKEVLAVCAHTCKRGISLLTPDVHVSSAHEAFCVGFLTAGRAAAPPWLKLVSPKESTPRR